MAWKLLHYAHLCLCTATTSDIWDLLTHSSYRSSVCLLCWHSSWRGAGIAVSTVNRLVAGWSGVRRFVCPIHTERLSPPTLLFYCYPCSFSGIKRPGREVDRSPLHSEKLRVNTVFGSTRYWPSWLGKGRPLPLPLLLLLLLGCVVSMVVTVTSASLWKHFRSLQIS